MAFDICGVGTLAADVLMTVDRLPGKDGFCMVRHVESQPGGSGTNVIVQAARLGSRCAYIGSVGDDLSGETVLSNLKEQGIDISHMIVRPGEVTTHTEIVVDEKGEKFVLLIMGDAFFKLKLTKADREAIHESKVFFTDLLPSWAALEGLKDACVADAKIVMSIQLGLPLMEHLGVTRGQLLKAMGYADLLAPCRDAVRDLTGTDNPYEAARYLQGYCDGIIVLTQGENGSLTFAPDGGIYHTPACPVKPVDTTGAGDSFLGALIYSYFIQGKPLEQCLQFASACAALTCTGLGAQFCPEEGYPPLE